GRPKSSKAPMPQHCGSLTAPTRKPAATLATTTCSAVLNEGIGAMGQPKSATHDYATSAIPVSSRKGMVALTATYAGFFASAFNRFVGGAIGGQLSFVDAVAATLIGGAVIMAICVGMAMIAYKRGLTTYMLARSSFGRVGQTVPSLVVVITQPAFAALY